MQGSMLQDLLEVAWVPMENAPTKDLMLPKAGTGLHRALLFVGADMELEKALATEFPDASFVEGTKETLLREALAVQMKEPHGAIIHAAALCETPEMEALQSALFVAQVAMEMASARQSVPPIWWVTKGTQECNVRGTAWTGETTVDWLKHWLTQLQKSEAETEVAIAQEASTVSRLTRAEKALPLKAGELLMSSRGLAPVLQESRQAPKASEAEIRVRAVGLNFRDVLNVMGLYPGDPGPPGADSAGTVLSTGTEITHIRPGEDVFGESPGCLRRYNCGPAALLSPKPDSWSFEEACCMPVIFVTVEEALGDLAQLKRGEKVLVHAAAGGVGLVAIQYAFHVGAEVYATAGAEEKHEFLRSMGVKYITSSRNGAKFEEDMKNFLKDSDGLDVVLNSLSHDDYIGRSLAMLKPGGRFMEIGKRGIWSHEQMFEARPDVMYEKIAADTMMDLEPWRYNAYMKRLVTRVEEGGLSPINMHIFEGIDNGVNAMQFLQRAKNIGKVVISQPSTMDLKADAHYVLSGGMGALGMVTAQYLLEEGAKSMSLLSRSGKPSADIVDLWEKLQASSLEISARSCDIASMDAVNQLALQLKGLPRVGGLVHLAAVLDDATMPKLTRGHLERSYGAKVWGARHLRCGLSDSEKPWDFALLFSSTSALLGSPGQGNYSAANAALDGHARYWKQVMQENVISVQWGPWREVGMAAQKGTVERLRASGVGALSNAFGMAALAGCLKPSPSTTLVAQPMRWAVYLKQYPKIPPFLSRFASEVKTVKPKAKAAPAMGAMGAAMGAAPVPQVDKASLKQMLQQIASEVAGGGAIDSETPLMDSGMDSLSAVEFRNRFTGKMPGVNLPNTLIFDYPTISSIADFTASQMGPAPAAAMPGYPPMPVAAGPSAAEVKQLLKRIASDTTGGAVEDEKPLMESGMDSLSAVEFRNRLATELPSLDLPNTLIFDYPTISSVAGYAAEQLGAVTMAMPSAMAGAAETRVPMSSGGGALDQQLSVTGMASNFPAAAWTTPAFGCAITQGVDGLVEVPFTRWELEEVWDPNPDAQGKMYPRHGAFIEGVEAFDAKFFGISPPEARAMDPQQRLLLESSVNSACLRGIHGG
ncbi:Phenolphthiocerol/phthiocerol polyketide synthase subunit C ((Phenol)carboxyphthiodiolenone synthase subunit C) (Beta-ketoacyl-acyl-carrier-protein synthase I) (Phthiocerol synthesis polyketide synthase type I PpsC) [Durusdinium trenchii]|uniref:Carrier domain-containing protein n=1 Tax=Durusdinium trenchii TaxID=1381693 RepID=A0ABP0MXF1_9DINO